MLPFDDPAVLEGASTSRYRHAFDAGYAGLRFPRPLEREFRRYRDAHNRTRVRWAALLAFVLFGLFVFIDFATLPREVAVRTAGVRVGLIMPMCLLVLSVAQSVPWRAYLQRTLLVAAITIGLGTVAIIAIALHAGALLPYEGILLVALYIYLVAGLSWRGAVVANLVTLCAFVVVEVALQADAQARMHQIVYLATANAVGAYGGYVLEHRARTTFLMQGMLNDLAERDGLTGLFNRRTLNSHLERVWRQAVREGTDVAVAMLDVDHFKRYNDRYGHTEGDAALRAVAAAIGPHARRPMDLAARYGGEEFVVLWYRVGGGDLAAMGEQLREAVRTLARPHEDSETGLLTASVGVASMRPDASGTSADLLRAADSALYRAKREGRDRSVVLVDPAPDSIRF